MTYDRFKEILWEYGYTELEIDRLWETRPPNQEISEDRIRAAAERTVPIRDTLRRL